MNMMQGLRIIIYSINSINLGCDALMPEDDIRRIILSHFVIPLFYAITAA